MKKATKYEFQILLSSANGEFFWRCVHKNGNIVANAAETYTAKAKAKRSLARFLFAAETKDYEVKDLTK